MTHFYDVKNHKGISVRSLMTQELLEKALITNISMHSTPYKSEIRRMITMTGGLGNVTKYRTVTSKAITEYFGAKRVLDPCIGWGGRMLGALSAGSDVEYAGCEPDTQTYKALLAILQDKAIPESVRHRATIFGEPAETAMSKIHQEEKFDLVLTSPPYFNLELYTAGEQSTNKYKTWDDWSEKWLKAIILGCLAALKPGGTSCWSVKNFKSDKKYPLADITKKIHKDAGWELVKTVTMRGSGRPGGKRIQGGEEKRESEEETFCFQKKA
jgi:16S rRNA G966 N2-methylase RsmD